MPKKFRVRTLRRIMIGSEAQPAGAALEIDGVDVAHLLDTRALELVSAKLRARPSETPTPGPMWQPIGTQFYQ